MISEDDKDKMKNRPLVLLDGSIAPCESPDAWREWFFEFISYGRSIEVPDSTIATWKKRALDEGYPGHPEVELGNPKRYMDSLMRESDS